MMPVVDVAVDGGQSGVRVRASAFAGELVAEGLGRFEGDLCAGLIERIRGCLAQLTGGVPAVGRMVLGLTTLPAAEPDRVELARRIADEFGAREVCVAGDALTAHAGAFSGAPGVVLMVGTGIACTGFDPGTGDIRLVDGDGFLLGDAGAGFWIGSRGVEAVLRARDGRDRATLLDEACLRRFGDHEGLAAHLHSLPRAVSAIAGFAVDVLDAARTGDPVAEAIVAAAADELARTARAAAAAVSMHPVPIALSGRLVAEGTPLRNAVDARFVDDEGCVIAQATGTPLDGAWALVTASRGSAYDRHMTVWRTR